MRRLFQIVSSLLVIDDVSVASSQSLVVVSPLRRKPQERQAGVTKYQRRYSQYFSGSAVF